jgi:hypothetical protein
MSSGIVSARDNCGKGDWVYKGKAIEVDGVLEDRRYRTGARLLIIYLFILTLASMATEV